MDEKIKKTVPHVKIGEAFTLLTNKVSYLESVVDDIGRKNLTYIDPGGPLDGGPVVAPDLSLPEVVSEAASIIRDLAGRIEIAAVNIIIIEKENYR
jgi:hypothetical protein